MSSDGSVLGGITPFLTMILVLKSCGFVVELDLSVYHSMALHDMYKCYLPITFSRKHIIICSIKANLTVLD